VRGKKIMVKYFSCTISAATESSIDFTSQQPKESEEVSPAKPWSVGSDLDGLD
jgi:hypothetical protein